MSAVKGVEVHDILGLSKPLQKLVETVSNAVGAFYAPTCVRRMAKAKAFELQTIGEAMTSGINLPSQYSDGKILIDTQDYNELAKRAGSRLIFQELQKQQNIESIMDIASDELATDASVSDEPVDNDWAIRFFNSVEDVSNEEMQKLWGKVLAGEVRQPGQFSVRTLEKLKNMTQKEAVLFAKVADFCISYGNRFQFIDMDDMLLRKYNIAFLDLLRLSDCGLLSLAETTFTLQENDSYTIHNQKLIAHFLFNGSASSVRLSIYSLTDAGRELFSIINKTPNVQYFIEYLSKIREKNIHVAVTAHKIESIDGNEIRYNKLHDELPPHKT